MRIPGFLSRLASCSAAAVVLSAALFIPISSAAYELVAGTADSGGGHSQGSRFAVEGTIGQPDTQRLDGSRFQLAGGFWAGVQAGPLPEPLFADGFED